MRDRRNVHSACAEFMVELSNRIPGMWCRLTRDGTADLPLTVHLVWDGGSDCLGDHVQGDAARDAVIAHARVMAERHEAVGAAVMFECCMRPLDGGADERVEALVLVLQRRTADDRVFSWMITRTRGRAHLGARLELESLDVAAYDVLHARPVEH